MLRGQERLDSAWVTATLTLTYGPGGGLGEKQAHVRPFASAAAPNDLGKAMTGEACHPPSYDK